MLSHKRTTPHPQLPTNTCVVCAPVRPPARYKAICTINGFWMDEMTKNNFQPSPAWMRDLQAGNPGQPWIWTEDQGWFDQWGVAKRVRDSRDQLYGIARFVARGGSWHNFYMLTGGNNYGKLSGGEVVTAYAPDTVIDFLLLRHQPRFDYYARFFHAVANVSTELLKSSVIPAAQPLVPIARHTHPSTSVTVTMGHCTDDDPSHVGRLDGSQQWQQRTQAAPDGVAGARAALAGAFVLANVGLGLCLDPLGSATAPALKACNGSGSMQWTYSADTQQFSSVAKRACLSPKSKGERCHVCLDLTGDKVDLWDCKTGGAASNQRFAYSSALLGITAGTGANRQCLTASAQGAGGVEVSVYGDDVAFLSNMDDSADVVVAYQGVTYYLPNHTVAIVRTGSNEVIFNSSQLEAPGSTAGRLGQGGAPAAGADRGGRVETHSTRTSEWAVFQEAVASGAQSKASPRGPIEQLVLTGGQAACQGYFTDYLWYSTSVPRSEDGQYSVETSGEYGTVLYHYVDGQLLQTQAAAAHAPQQVAPQQLATRTGGRGSMYAANAQGAQGLESHTATGVVAGLGGSSAAGPATLQVLSVAMGLSNGGVGPKSGKGLTSAKVNGLDVTNNTWDHQWSMQGEAKQIWDNPGAVDWRAVAGTAGDDNNSSLAWFKATYDLPAPVRLGDDSVSFALSLSGANKGVAFVNGFELGRYWLENGSCYGACAPPIKSGHCYMHWSDCGKPTQTLYHIPAPVLKPTGNLVVIFEETATAAQRDLDKIQLVQLHNY